MTRAKKGERERRGRCVLVAVAAKSVLCRDGKERVGKLREDRAEQRQFSLAQIAGKSIGKGSNESGQFTGIHKPITSHAIL